MVPKIKKGWLEAFRAISCFVKLFFEPFQAFWAFSGLSSLSDPFRTFQTFGGSSSLFEHLWLFWSSIIILFIGIFLWFTNPTPDSPLLQVPGGTKKTERRRSRSRSRQEIESELARKVNEIPMVHDTIEYLLSTYSLIKASTTGSLIKLHIYHVRFNISSCRNEDANRIKI